VAWSQVSEIRPVLTVWPAQGSVINLKNA